MALVMLMLGMGMACLGQQPHSPQKAETHDAPDGEDASLPGDVRDAHGAPLACDGARQACGDDGAPARCAHDDAPPECGALQRSHGSFSP